MNVRWTRLALNDLGEIGDYIARDDPAAAQRVGRMIEAAVGRLAEHPYSGPAGRVEGTRELVVPRLPYILAYQIKDDAIHILAVRHGARHWPSDFT